MMPYFPMFTNIEGSLWIIAGGGAVALRKARTLKMFGARIRVIAPEICGELAEIGAELIYAPAAADDFKDADFAIAATNRREVNSGIAEYCRERGIPVNVADSKEECTFFFPAVVVDGDVCIGISSGGKDPSLCRRIREEIERR